MGFRCGHGHRGSRRCRPRGRGGGAGGCGWRGGRRCGRGCCGGWRFVFAKCRGGIRRGGGALRSGGGVVAATAGGEGGHQEQGRQQQGRHTPCAHRRVAVVVLVSHPFSPRTVQFPAGIHRRSCTGAGPRGATSGCDWRLVDLAAPGSQGGGGSAGGSARVRQACIGRIKSTGLSPRFRNFHSSVVFSYVVCVGMGGKTPRGQGSGPAPVRSSRHTQPAIPRGW